MAVATTTAATRLGITSYEDAKLQSLRGALLIIAIVGILGLLLTRRLPRDPLTDAPSRDGPAAA